MTTYTYLYKKINNKTQENKEEANTPKEAAEKVLGGKVARVGRYEEDYDIIIIAKTNDKRGCIHDRWFKYKRCGS